MSNQRYTPEFKDEAVRQVLEHSDRKSYYTRSDIWDSIPGMVSLQLSWQQELSALTRALPLPEALYSVCCHQLIHLQIECTVGQ